GGMGMERMAEWGSAAVVQRLQMLTQRIADGLQNTGVSVPDAEFRAPHILSLGFPKGMPAGLVEDLAGEGIYVAPRLGRMRISPHVYNDEPDVDRFVAALGKRLRGWGAVPRPGIPGWGVSTRPRISTFPLPYF